MAQAKDGVSTIIIGGEDYGSCSSRDWAAKGTNPSWASKPSSPRASSASTGSNLIGMGVLPLNFANPADYDRVKDPGDALLRIIGLHNDMAPTQRCHPCWCSPPVQSPSSCPSSCASTR